MPPPRFLGFGDNSTGSTDRKDSDPDTNRCVAAFGFPTEFVSLLFREEYAKYHNLRVRLISRYGVFDAGAIVPRSPLENIYGPRRQQGYRRE